MMRKILAFFRDWLTRWKIRWSMRRFCKEGQAEEQEVEPAYGHNEADAGEPAPGWPEFSTATNRQQLVGRCKIEFQMPPKMLRDIERLVKQRRKARRCLYLSQHGKTARIRKKNAKRAEALDGPLVFHIPSPEPTGPIAWWLRNPYGPGVYIREVDVREDTAFWLRPRHGWML